MDDSNSVPSSNEDHPRLKFLCSFNGGVLPRPQDGKLRYVGGETRIVNLPRDIGFAELMGKMKELFDEACVLKYQQPDEDLDALVSVVNDDDVTNMMEEYEKLGSGDGFTRLRMFLFSSSEQDDSVHFVDRDERDSERRYVDALNSHNDGPVDDFQPVEQLYNQLNLDENHQNQRNFEMLNSPVNLKQVRVSHQQSLNNWYSEMESPWSPAYFSPRNVGNDFPNSPSSSHYHTPYGVPMDKSYHPDDYFRQQNQPSHYDQQLLLPEPVAGFPGNILHQVSNPCAECPPRPLYNTNSHYEDQTHQTMVTGYPNGYGAENVYPQANVFWRNGQSPNHGLPSYEPLQENGAGIVRTTMDYGPRVPVHHLPTEPVQFVPAPVQFMPGPAQFSPVPIQHTSDPVNFTPEAVQSTPVPVNPLVTEATSLSSGIHGTEKMNSSVKQIIGAETIEPAKNTDYADEAKDEAQENCAFATVNDVKVREEEDVMDAPGDLELESGNTKIEPTKAEEEAVARGLQTVKNDDLEEVRELGCGTYGSVYHGKWKGSDVAIKRIKSSCFAGKPSERDRLIADFWKEALILSSLHHPNVVSFYGIVRDGPDGSLATVTEFMVNGSLKQFLQKKDRTIDRRKRLIIAMDAAFGMEYLHGKNIVHFDLKCENLLVNMRDPHRPICKIGDLGLSKVKQHTLVSGGVRGTLSWMAPELLSGKSNMVSEKIDVYSFGIVMWELLTGDEPYGDMHCASIIGGILNNSLRPTIPTWCDPEWKALMEACWSGDPAERPSFLEISQKLRNMAAANNVK